MVGAFAGPWGNVRNLYVSRGAYAGGRGAAGEYIDPSARKKRGPQDDNR
jgi:hypothetical protein